MRPLAALAFALLPLAAAAQAWPPPPAVEARMHELQGVLASRDSSAAQREAAREELSRLLKSPAGQSKRTPEERPAQRATIEPIPRIVRPAENPRQFQPPVASLDVVDPPKPMVVPQTGSVTAPSGTFAVDPRTGSVLHQVPGGFVDPRTGQVVPR